MNKEHQNIIINLAENQLYELAENFTSNDYEMKNNQIYGIENVFRAENNVETLKRYLQNQRQKSTKNQSEKIFFNDVHSI
jgi:hypothetical protein